MISCEIFRRHVDAMIDGEVDPNSQIELDEHLARCGECRDHVAFASSFKRQVSSTLSGMRAPEGLRARLLAAMDAEDAQTGTASAPVVVLQPVLLQPEAQPERDAPLGLRLPFVRPRYAIPAAAAAVALAFVAAQQGRNPASDAPATENPDPLAAAIFQEVVHRHSVEHPTEVSGSETQVANWFRGTLGYPVRPMEFGPDAHLRGARLSTVGDRDAATFYYDIEGRRVTVVAFQPPEPVDRMAQRTTVEGHDVYVGQANGQTVPVVQYGGLTYAIAGDLDRTQLLHLAASARVDAP